MSAATTAPKQQPIPAPHVYARTVICNADSRGVLTSRRPGGRVGRSGRFASPQSANRQDRSNVARSSKTTCTLASRARSTKLAGVAAVEWDDGQPNRFWTFRGFRDAGLLCLGRTWSVVHFGIRGILLARIGLWFPTGSVTFRHRRVHLGPSRRMALGAAPLHR
jgi:hypothetical protein